MSDTTIDKPSSMIFPPLSGPRAEESSAGDTRWFTVPKMENGNDPTELAIPGCKKVMSVRIGSTVLPTFIEYEAPDSVTFTKKLSVKLPAYALDRNYEGVAVLRRNPYSNDGKWQSGERVYVVGEWEADAAPANGKKV